MEKAEQLIYCDKSGELQTNSNGLQALKDIPYNYGIVSVSMVGDGRIGKSSLLNQIAGKNVFEVGSTTKRVTKGIWIFVRLDHTSETAYMYCDVEGFGDPSKNNCDGEDKCMLVIICQICDIIMFNIKGVYSDDLLQKLKFTSVLFKKYRKKNTVLSDPGLLVVLRDFYLDQPQSPDNELMQLFEGNHDFFNSFRSVKPFHLVMPTETKRLRDLNDLPDSALDTVFVEERNRLQAHLKSEAKPLCSQKGKAHLKSEAKPLCSQKGNSIPGIVLVELIQETIKAVNSDNLGNITQTLPDLLQQANQRSKKTALKSYEQQVTKNWPPTSEPETLQTRLQTWKQKIKAGLQDELVDFDDSVRCLLQDFEAETEQIFDRLSKKICEKELARVSSSFGTNLKQNTYCQIGGHKKYLSDKTIVEAEYKQLTNLGPKVESVWRTYEKELQPKEEKIKEREENLLRVKMVEREKDQAISAEKIARVAQEKAERELSSKKEDQYTVIAGHAVVQVAVHCLTKKIFG